MTSAVWICGEGTYSEAVGDAPPALKAAVQDAIGVPVRRIGRFIQLALIGTGRCVGERHPAAETAVYMSSARGDLDTTLEVLDALFREGIPPMPLSFVNTVSNAPCYYVARHFGLAGRSNFICSRCFALESVLELAMLDIASGYMEAALVGSVDVATSPLADHRRRLQVAPDTPIAEGSHWLWLRADQQRPDDAMGELVAAREFADRAALVDWLRAAGAPGADPRIAAGQFADQDDVAAAGDACGAAARFEPPSPPGFYDSQAGHTIQAFLAAGEGDSLVLVNGELDGPRMTAVLIRR